MTCCTRSTLEAKVATKILVFLYSANKVSKVLPTVISDAVYPGRSALVESHINANTPFFPSSAKRGRSMASPYTGDRWCLLKFHGKWYQITSFNEDYQENQIQMTAVELANQQVNIVEPTPEPTPTPDPEPETPAVNPEQQNDGTINDNNNDSNS